MISLKQINKIMLKIFSVMEKINKFSNQMAGSGLSSDYSKAVSYTHLTLPTKA